MASFQGKIGWQKAEKKRKEKLSFRLVSTRPGIENSIKYRKKIQKIKKTPLWTLSKPKQVGKG